MALCSSFAAHILSGLSDIKARLHTEWIFKQENYTKVPTYALDEICIILLKLNYG